MENKYVKIKVWDLPIRLFHWTMVMLMALLWWSAEVGEMQWHLIFAYSLLILIAFRLIWGVIGSDTAKFNHFVHRPNVVVRYLKDVRAAGVQVVPGHNPLGGYMVVLLIAMVSLQLISGLFATDEIFTEGPLFSYVSSSTSAALTTVHKLNFNLILGLSALHVVAIIVHAIKGDKLVGAMLSGYKKVPQDSLSSVAASQLRFKSIWLALIFVMGLAGVVFAFLIWPIVQVL
ncbi:MAG: cytochrome b/b6 domain-containing protein [Shewanella sp.]